MPAALFFFIYLFYFILFAAWIVMPATVFKRGESFFQAYLKKGLKQFHKVFTELIK